MTYDYIIGIDPGPETGGMVRIEIDPLRRLYGRDDATIVDIREELRGSGFHGTLVAIEGLRSYGTVIGSSTIRTAYMIGQVLEMCDSMRLLHCLIDRPTVALELAGTPRAKDGGLSEICRGMFPQAGGGAKPAVGTKAQPGPLYGIAGGHQWSALHVAMAAREQLSRGMRLGEEA